MKNANVTVDYHTCVGMYPRELREIKSRSCSGVQISPRHILTAAHCVLEKDLKRMLSVSGFKIYFGSDCVRPIGCVTPHYAVKITAKKYTGYSADDLAIIALRDNVSPREALPICMPQKRTVLAKLLKAAGAGID
ncbi:hypothetical protein ANCCAN_11026, partial [Ancylostoma caninum]